ncbi:MAG: diaminopimelate epimerase [Flavobacteriales bacterium]
MSIDFFKYQATGNDFILVDDRKNVFPESNLALITRMCHRKWGVGSDGLILIKNSKEADFEMVFFNPDGSKSFCGNGSRSAVVFAHSLGIITNTCTFRAIDGIHSGVIHGSEVTIHMNDVKEINNVSDSEFFIHTGSPHFIRYVKNVDEININEQAVAIRYADAYKPGGTNVNFVEEIPAGISMRTYERGVEGETLSCGTGVTAAGLSYLFKYKKEGTVNVTTKGGQLQVKATKKSDGFSDITLTGPVQLVFSGNYGY